MRLRSLAMRNFRRHAASEVEFPDGVTAVVGPNGAGKSTLLEAISFALFGADGLTTGKALLRHDGAAPADAVSVVLQLELAGQGVEVVRELRGRNQTPNAQLTIDGHVIVPAGAGSNEAATSKVQELLGMDREAFHTTIVARQGELSRLADTKPAERKRLVLRMLGIERIDQAIEKARVARRDAESRLLQTRQMAPDPAVLEQQRIAAAANQAAARDRLAAATKAHEDARKAQLAGDQALQVAREKGALAQQAKQAVVNAQALDVAARARVDRAGKQQQLVKLAQAEAERHAPVAAQRDALETEWQAAQEATAKARARVVAEQRIAALVQRQAEASQRLAKLVDPPVPDLAPLATAVEAATQHRIQTHARNEAAKRDVRQLQERAARLEKLGGDAPCPTCERPLAGHADRLHTDARAQLQAAHESVRESLAAAGAADVALRSATTSLDDARRLQQDAARVTAERTVVERALLQYAADLVLARRELPPAAPPPASVEDLRARRAAAGAAHDGLQRALATASQAPAIDAELVAAQAEVAKVQTQLESARAAAAAFAGVDEALQRAVVAHDAARIAERNAAMVQLRAADEQAAADVAVATTAARIEDAQRIRAEATRLETELVEWSALAGARGDGILERFRDHLVDRIGPAIQKEASRLLSAFTGGRYTDVLLNADYDVFVMDGGTNYELERFSGGEQDLVHLALRLAVSRMLAQRSGLEVRLLALDEVFGSLDGERRGHVVAALQSLSTIYQQVLVVSHLEALQEALDQAIVVVPQGSVSTLQLSHA